MLAHIKSRKSFVPNIHPNQAGNMFAHESWPFRFFPAIKRKQEGWLRDGFLIDRRRQNASAPEIPDKQTDAVLQLQPMRTTVPRALAKVQMLGKLLDESLF
jgi:hypothetical protein